MKLTPRNANFLLLLAAAIWGFAFVAQRVGMRYVGPLTFNGVRFALGAAALMPLLMWGRRNRANSGAGDGPGDRALVIKGGIVAGLILFCGATLQQYGVVYTTAGKAGFITGLYVVFVPLLGLLVGYRTGRFVWAGAVAAAVGLYLLSAKGIVGIDPGDGLVLLGALFWAAHVLVIGRLSRRIAPVRLAVAQFTVVSVLSLLGAVVFETIEWVALRRAAIPILYAGLLSVAVAYTLQVVAQQRARPAHAAIILSFESVFAAFGGWWILSEGLSARGIIGCVLMLAGVLLAQADSDQYHEVSEAAPQG
ncbi:MAG: DMT family transporter [Candidatus Krumholzibacteriota bacterium]